MTEVNLLVNLPTSVGQSIISQWLTGRSLGKLDAAYCNRANRRCLFEFYDRCMLNFEIKHTSTEYMRMLRWMYARQARRAHFEFDSSLSLVLKDQLLLHSYLQKTGTWLKSVNIIGDNEEMTSEVLGILASINCSLSKLKIQTEPGDDTPHWAATLKIVLKNSAATLTHLDVGLPIGGLPKDVRFPVLVTIHMHYCSDTDLISTCSAAPNIRIMYLSNPVCSYIGLGAIAQHCLHLEQLTLNEAHHVVGMDEAITRIVSACQKLKKLNLIWCQHLRDTGLDAIATHCTQLEEFRITMNSHITDARLTSLLQERGANLRALSISACFHLRSTVIAAIATHCGMLHTLDISYLSITSSIELNLAIPQLQHIVRLNVSNWDIDDTLLHLIITHMLLLEDLSIRPDYRPRYTLQGLFALVQGCEKLRILDVGIPYDFSLMVQWLRLRPGLRILPG